MIYVLSFLVIVSPLLFAVLLSSSLAIQTKLVLSLGLLMLILVAPLAVIYFTTGFNLL